MTRTILLDSGPLGLVTNPRGSSETIACAQWVLSCRAAGNTVVVPAIADYEVRRELIRARRTRGIDRLDDFIVQIGYLALTTEAMHRAASFWAFARQTGRPTASDAALDGDVILAAQADALGHDQVIVATTNVGHLSRFVAAARWRDIPPH